MSGVLRTFLWLALSGFMLYSIDLLSFCLNRKSWRRFVSTFVLFVGQIIITEFLLGALTILTSKTLLMLNLAISGSILTYLIRKNGWVLFSQYKATLLQAKRNVWRQLIDDPLFCGITLLALLFLVWVIFLGILFPATDFDGNSYHLTFVGYVMQNHTFFDVPTSLKWLTGYPKGGEFIQMWSVIIPRSDMFVDLIQVPFVGLGVYSLYTILRQINISSRNARFAAMLFIFIPIVLNQLKTTYVDVMLCSLFFAALAMVVQNKLIKLDLLLLGIIYSLIISIKSTGVLFVAATTPLLFWNLFQNRGSGKYGRLVRDYLKPLAFVAIPLVFGLYWYLKNWILYGSPIYPFGFKLLGHSIFPGQTFQEFAANATSGLQALPKGCVQRIWFVWTEQKDWFGCFYNYDTNYTGLGPIWFILLIPALLTATYLSFKRRNSKALAVGVILLGLFVVYPTNYYSRYTIFITALGILALGLVLDSLTVTYQRIVKVIAILLSVSVLLTNFALCNFPPGTVKAQIKNFRSNLSRGPIYNNLPGAAFVFLESQTKAHDLVVYDSSPYFIYPLWRPDFSNKVEYIQSNNQKDWLRQVYQKNTRFVFTTYYSRENKWAESNFKRIYKDEMYNVYQVN